MFKDQRPGLFASDAEKQAFNAKVSATSKLVSGAVAAYSGGNAQTAITTAEVAVTNNFLSYNRSNGRASQWGSFKQELDSCKVTAGCDVSGVYSRWTAISNDQQRQAMGSMDALFAAIPSEASAAGQWFGKAVSSMFMDPRDVCSAGDARCISFVQAQQNQAMAVYRSGLTVAYANDLVDGGGGIRSSVLEAPPPGVNGRAVADEIAALNRIGRSANGPTLNGKAPNSVLNQKAISDLAEGKLPGNPIGGVGKPYTPREMPGSLNPSATAEDFASRWFGTTSTPNIAKPILIAADVGAQQTPMESL
jgi:hypothetical protein